MKLNQNAKMALRAAGISQIGWARLNFMPNGWCGDACGCSDDRCIGHHHENAEDCRCLPAMLENFFSDRATWFEDVPRERWMARVDPWMARVDQSLNGSLPSDDIASHG